MENIEKKTPLNDLMDTTMEKIRDMVDSNTIIGEPIQTPDGVTVIPVSRVSFGFGAGGGDYGKTDTAHFGGGAGAGCSTELYAVDPERRYTSPAARLRYADSCRIQLRGSGVVMKDITESAGYDGSTRLTDRFS